MQLQASPVRFGDLVSGMSEYAIPYFQREYTWKSEKADILLDDIEAVASSSDHDANLFLGSIVLRSDSNKSNYYDIVDGQQRFTTLFLLLASIYYWKNIIDLSEKSEPTSSDVSFDNYDTAVSLLQEVRSKLLISYQGKFRLRLALYHEKSAFEELITVITRSTARHEIPTKANEIIENYSRSKSKTKKNIATNFITFNNRIENRLGNKDKSESVLLLSSLAQVILWSVEFIKIETPLMKDSLTIFRTLNSRGEKLEPSDIVKALFIEKSDTPMDTARVWTGIENTIQGLNTAANSNIMTRFLRHWYISMHSYIEESELIDEYEKTLTSKVITSSTLRKLNEEKSPYAYFASGSEITGGMQPPISVELSQIVEILSATFKLSAVFPLLLASIARFGSTNIAAQLLVAKYIETFVYRNYVLERRISVANLEKLMGDIARNIRNGQNLKAALARMVDFSDDKIFLTDFSLAKLSQGRIAFYTIYKFERSLLGSDQGGIIPYTQSYTQHLEHILPAKPADFAEWGIRTSIQHKEYLNRIGNHLVLEKDINTRIKNKNFATKISSPDTRDYSHSQLYFPRELSAMVNNTGYPNHQINHPYSNVSFFANDANWKPELIEKRQQHLAKFAPYIWSYPTIQED
jgi:hypothetical protein